MAPIGTTGATESLVGIVSMSHADQVDSIVVYTRSSGPSTIHPSLLTLAPSCVAIPADKTGNCVSSADDDQLACY